METRFAIIMNLRLSGSVIFADNIPVTIGIKKQDLLCGSQTYWNSYVVPPTLLLFKGHALITIQDIMN